MKHISLGVIVARFQVAKLHAGHHHLLQHVVDRHEQVLVVLGSTGGEHDHRNPLSFAVRADMLQEQYRDLIVAELFDNSSNDTWSIHLDRIIEAHTSTGAVLYESRDGFGRHYRGQYSVVTIPPLPSVPSGTDTRNGLGTWPITDAVRAGMILQEQRRLPISYQTVDIGLIKYETGELLMGQKPDEDGWRLFGGFVDPTDPSLEAAALRELTEEAGNTLMTHGVSYLGSYRVDDARYRGGRDAMLTALFGAYYLGGETEAGDDIARVRWVPLSEALSIARPDHHTLIQRIIDFHQSAQA